MLLGHTLAGAPILDIEEIAPGPTLARLARGTSQKLTFLLEIDGAVKADPDEAEVRGDFGILEMPILGYEGGIGTLAPPVTLRLATRPWVGRDDDRERKNVDYVPAIKRGVTWESTLPLSPTEPRRSSLKVADIPLAAAPEEPSGLADKIATLAWTGRASRGYLGRAEDPFDQFIKIFGATNQGFTWDGRSAPRLHLADADYLFRSPFQRVFSGRGGLFGDPALKDKSQPLCFGRLFNVPGALLNAERQIFWLHQRRIGGLLDARVRGLSFMTGAVQFATSNELWDAEIPEGRIGYFLGAPNLPAQVRFGGALSADEINTVRFDVDGDRRNFGGYSSAIDDILVALNTDFGNVPERRLRPDTLSLFSANPAGWYFGVDDMPTLEEANDQILGGLYGWISTGVDLKIAVAPVMVPEEIDESGDLRLGREDVIRFSTPQIPTPLFRQAVAFRKNWAPLSQDQVSSDIWEDNPILGRQIIAEQQEVTVEQGFVTLRTGGAAQMGGLLVSPYWDAQPARRIASRILKMFNGERSLVQVDVAGFGFQAEPGTCVSFDYDVAGLSERRYLVVNQRIELGQRNTLLLYG